MSSRELIKKIINNEPTERCGFWLGNPDVETIEKYEHELGINGLDEIQIHFGDDIRWITPQYSPTIYQHPDGKPLRPWKTENPLGLSNGPLAFAETVDDIESYDWPETQYLNFTETIERLENAGNYYRMSGFWSPFYHDLCSILGTEDLLLKMYTHPSVVHAMLDKLCGFYYNANELFYAQAGNRIDAHFMGNDFGSQTDLMMSPELFEEFFLPWIQKFANQAHNHGLHCIMHSCGAIYRIIDKLIDAGVDCIHPIQALATNMNAEYLAENFKGKISFMGGVDTQDLLTNGSPEDVVKFTANLKHLLAPNLIVSPSHETLMPNVSLQNVTAMAKTAKQ